MKITCFIMLIFFINCKSKQPETDLIGDKKIAVPIAVIKKNETINKNGFEKQISLSSLKNTKWVFDNYSIPVDSKDYKKPTLVFTDVNTSVLKFSGESYVNIYLGKFKSNNKRNFFFDRASYKISTFYSQDKRLEYLEFRYIKDMKRANSIKAYNEKLVLGIKNSLITMNFIKM